MNANRDVTRIVRSWLRTNEHESADRILDVVLDRLDATPQRTVTWWPARRFPQMNAMTRYGIAAVAVAVAILAGYTLFFSKPVGPAPISTSSPSPSADASTSGELIPAELRHRFPGATRAAASSAGGDRSILELTDSELRVHTGVSVVFASDASLVGGNTLLVVTKPASSGGCETGDEGRYPISLSPGGSILTIGEGTDDCAERAAALPGDWQTATCRNPDNDCLGNLEAGTYSSVFFEPRPDGVWHARYGALTYSVPEGWAAAGDWPENYGLMRQSDYATFDAEACSECADQIGVWVNPRAASLDCSESFIPEVGPSVDQIVSWLTEHPGLVVSEPQPITINGLSGTIVDLEMADGWTGTCPAAELFVAVPMLYNGYHLAIGVDDRQRFILLDLGDGNTVAVVVDSRETADFDAFVAEAMPIVETFEFPEP